MSPRKSKIGEACFSTGRSRSTCIRQSHTCIDVILQTDRDPEDEA